MSVGFRTLSLAALALVVATAGVRGAAVNIDFGDAPGTAVYSGVGGADDTGTVWNGVTGGDPFVATGLLNSQGVSTSVGISIEGFADNDILGQQQLGDYADLMYDYVNLRGDDGYENGDFSLSENNMITGLQPGGSYDLYFYGQGDNHTPEIDEAPPGWNGGQNVGVQIGSDVRHTSWDGVDGGDGFLVEDIEYVRFPGIIADSAGTITFSWFNINENSPDDTSTGLADLDNNFSRFAALNGIQIVGDFSPSLILEVNTMTGEVLLKNENTFAVSIFEYSITSEQGTLNPAQWNTLQSQGLGAGGGTTGGDFNADGKVDAADYALWRNNLGAPDESALNGAGDDSGSVDEGDYDLWRENYGSAGSGGWAAAGGASDSYLGEFYLGETEEDVFDVEPGAEISLGFAFDPLELGPNLSDETLLFEYFLAGGFSAIGSINFVTGGGGLAAAPEPTAAWLASLLIACGACFPRMGRS